MRVIWVLLAWASLSVAPANAARLVVVELFTSQGCSSCPPADAFLADLARDRADLLPLAFHVTYWNGLGWRDPYSLDAATDRQRRYAALLPAEIYTPQMVVDGRVDVVGSDRAMAMSALRMAADHAVAATAVDIAQAGSGLRITLSAGVGAGTIWLVGYDHWHQTPVARGENGGRTLTEANIVRSVASLGRWTGRPLTLAAAPPQGEAAAVIVQAEDGAVLGAARL